MWHRRATPPHRRCLPGHPLARAMTPRMWPKTPSGGLSHPEYLGRELGIDLDQLWRHHRPHDAQILAGGGERRSHVLATVEGEDAVLDHLGDGVPGMHAGEREAPSAAVEREQAAIGDEGARAAGTIDIVRARSRGADEIDLLDQGAARGLDAKQDD